MCFRYPYAPQKGYGKLYMYDLSTYILRSFVIFHSGLIALIVLAPDDTKWGRSWAQAIAYRSFFKMQDTSPYSRVASAPEVHTWRVEC